MRMSLVSSSSFSRRAIEVVLEIRENLEVLAQFRIERDEQEVEQTLAEQDDLHLDRNRIGLQRNGAGQPQKPCNILDRDVAAAQASASAPSS